MQGTEACGGRGRWLEGDSPNATCSSLSVIEDVVPACDQLRPPEFAVRSWPVVHELADGLAYLPCLSFSAELLGRTHWHGPRGPNPLVTFEHVDISM